MSSRIYVKPNMKVIPLEGEGLTPLSANGIKIKVPDVIPEPGWMPTKPVQKTSAATSGRRNKKPAPRSEHFWRQASMSQESCRQFRQYMV